MNMAGEVHTITNFKQALSTTRHLYFISAVYFPILQKGYFTLLFQHTSNTSTFSMPYSQPMTLPHIIEKIEAFYLRSTPASILNQLSSEKPLVNVINESTLLNPRVNFQSSSYSIYQQHLSQLITPSILIW